MISIDGKQIKLQIWDTVRVKPRSLSLICSDDISVAVVACSWGGRGAVCRYVSTVAFALAFNLRPRPVHSMPVGGLVGCGGVNRRGQPAGSTSASTGFGRTWG